MIYTMLNKFKEVTPLLALYECFSCSNFLFPKLGIMSKNWNILNLKEKINHITYTETFMIKNKTCRIAKNKFLNNFNLTRKSDNHKHRGIFTNYDCTRYLPSLKSSAKQIQHFANFLHRFIFWGFKATHAYWCSSLIILRKTLSNPGLPNWGQYVPFHTIWVFIFHISS